MRRGEDAVCGMDGPTDVRIYDRFVGCQSRMVLDFKKDEVALSVSESVMIALELIAALEASLVCGGSSSTFWAWVQAQPL